MERNRSILLSKDRHCGVLIDSLEMEAIWKAKIVQIIQKLKPKDLTDDCVRETRNFRKLGNRRSLAGVCWSSQEFLTASEKRFSRQTIWMLDKLIVPNYFG